MSSISKMAGFDTPKSLEEIREYVNSRPPMERIAMWEAVAMTWNFLAETSNEVKGRSPSS